MRCNYQGRTWAVTTSMSTYIVASCHSHYTVGSCCWQSSMRPNLSQYYTAHQWAVLILYCSSLSSCNFNVVLYLYSGIDATSTLLWDNAAMKAVWEHTRSFLRHHCRLWLRHHADLTRGITANSVRRLIGRLAASLPTWVIFILLIDEQLRLPCRLISL
jgi:hypothetical protein